MVNGTSMYDFACVFWDYSLEDWSTDGCSKGNASDGFFRCFCNHTTNFAALWVNINSAADKFSNEIKAGFIRLRSDTMSGIKNVVGRLSGTQKPWSEATYMLYITSYSNQVKTEKMHQDGKFVKT